MKKLRFTALSVILALMLCACSHSYDVVVVSGGLAGLSAAVEAHEAGARVALIEKEGILGGTSLFSSGDFSPAKTPEAVANAESSATKSVSL